MQQNFQTARRHWSRSIQEYGRPEGGDPQEDRGYLKDYNKQRNYSYIFAYDPSSFIYNKDTIYNITYDLIQGLNAAYKKEMNLLFFIIFNLRSMAETTNTLSNLLLDCSTAQ